MRPVRAAPELLLAAAPMLLTAHRVSRHDAPIEADPNAAEKWAAPPRRSDPSRLLRAREERDRAAHDYGADIPKSGSSGSW